MTPVIQYADDIMVMSAYPRQAEQMKLILSDYATSVGLCINFHKSTMVPINLDHAENVCFGPYLSVCGGTNVVYLPGVAFGHHTPLPPWILCH